VCFNFPGLSASYISGWQAVTNDKHFICEHLNPKGSEIVIVTSGELLEEGPFFILEVRLEWHLPSTVVLTCLNRS
jgi:hypothetical protein